MDLDSKNVNNWFSFNMIEFTAVNIDGKVGTIGYIPRWLYWMSPAGLIKVDEETGEVIRNPKTGLAIQCDINEPGEWVSVTGGVYALVDFHGYVLFSPLSLPETSKKFSFPCYIICSLENITSYKNANTDKKILRDIYRKGDTCYRSGTHLSWRHGSFFHKSYFSLFSSIPTLNAYFFFRGFDAHG